MKKKIIKKKQLEKKKETIKMQIFYFCYKFLRMSKKSMEDKSCNEKKDDT